LELLSAHRTHRFFADPNVYALEAERVVATISNTFVFDRIKADTTTLAVLDSFRDLLDLLFDFVEPFLHVLALVVAVTFIFVNVVRRHVQSYLQVRCLSRKLV
jgi:hypothetical protein